MITSPTPTQQPSVRPSQTQIINLAVPPSTSWKPQVVNQLMTSLFTLPQLQFQITAARGSIRWQIEVPTGHEQAVAQTLYAHYPRAEMTRQAKTRIEPGAYLYQFDAAGPFIGPLQYADDFGTLDPLPTLLSAMAQIGEQEAIRYELKLKDAAEAWYKLGEKLSRRSLTNWLSFLTIPGAITAATRKALNADEVDRFVPTLQRLVDGKLHSLLKEAQLSIKIYAASDQRANELMALLLPGLAVFERPASNLLVPPQQTTYALVLSAPEVAALWHPPTDQCQVPGIVWAAAAASPLSPRLASQPRNGVKLGINQYQGKQQEVWLPYADRVTHVNIVGKTRVGKSTLLHHLIHQDIAAGKGVGVIDPHGYLVEQILATSIPPEREADVVLFDLTDTEFPIALNLLTTPEGVPIGTVASQTLSIIRKLFASAWNPGRMEDALYAALVTLLSAGGTTIQTVSKLFYDSAYRTDILQRVTDPVALEFWFEEYELLNSSYQREFARPITNRLRKFYRNEVIRPIVCQPDSLDFTRILDEGKIFLARLDGIPDVDSETLGALLIAKFQLAAMSRTRAAAETLPEFYLHIDEVQNFVTTSLATMLSESGKFGLRLTVVNQFLKQLAGDTLDAVMGNIGTTVLFRLGPDDARALAPFVKPQHTSDDLVALDRFNTIISLQLDGQTIPAFSLATLPPVPQPADAQERMVRIRALSRERYARPRAQVEAELIARLQAQRPDSQTDDEDAELGYLG